MAINYQDRKLGPAEKIKDSYDKINQNSGEAKIDLKSLQGQIDSISTADSNASIGVYTITDVTNTNDYVGNITGLTLFDDLRLDLEVTNSNTGDATLDIGDGGGAKSIKFINSQGDKVDLPAGKLFGVNTLKYDGTDWVLLEKKLKGTTINLRDYGVVSDGVNDQTTYIVSLFQNELSGIRGIVKIPYNTKFDIDIVYDSFPVGIIVKDESMINGYYSSTYKRKYYTIGSNDRTNDDTSLQILSNHHAVLLINNMGDAVDEGGSPTISASENKASIVFSRGFRPDKNPKTLWRVTSQLQSVSTGVMLRFANTHTWDDPDTDIDRTIFAFNEGGYVGINTQPVTGFNLAVLQQGTDTSTSAILENNNDNSQVSLSFRNKDSGGVQQRIYLTETSDGSFSIRDNSNVAIMTLTQDRFASFSYGVSGGTTRPSAPPIGTMVFDTTLGKPVWFDGTNYVDATGAVV